MEMQGIQRVRRFNRVLTQRIGVLDESYLKLGRPLGEARLIYEIGDKGADLRELRRSLALDSGYISRLLRSLERQGLVEVEADSGDARRRRVTLTKAGRTALNDYDQLSNAFAQSILAPLSPEQRARLSSAMDEVERLIGASAVSIRIEAPDSTAARWCFGQYFNELAARFEGGFDRARYVALSPDAELVPPTGLVLLAWLDGRPVGCGALKIHGRGIGEIKRVWTAESARGLGIAARIMGKLEELAAAAGVSTIRLGTNKALTEAQAMYRKLGYRDVPPFDDDPFTHHWFEKNAQGDHDP